MPKLRALVSRFMSKTKILHLIFEKISYLQHKSLINEGIKKEDLRLHLGCGSRILSRP